MNLKLAVLCAAFAAAPAMAGQYVAFDGTDTIRLNEAPCTSPTVLSHLDADVRAEFHSASATLQGQKYEACWRITPIAAHLVYEDGDQGLVPLGKLNPTTDI